MAIEVGASEAKNQFSRLLARVRRGETVTITHRGSPVAKLAPADDRSSAEQARQALARLRRAAGNHIGEPISREEILTWIAEDRR